jgi:hypothetical protein
MMTVIKKYKNFTKCGAQHNETKNNDTQNNNKNATFCIMTSSTTNKNATQLNRPNYQYIIKISMKHFRARCCLLIVMLGVGAKCGF